MFVVGSGPAPKLPAPALGTAPGGEKQEHTWPPRARARRRLTTNRAQGMWFPLAEGATGPHHWPADAETEANPPHEHTGLFFMS